MNATATTIAGKILAAVLTMASTLVSVSARADMLVTSYSDGSVLGCDGATGE